MLYSCAKDYQRICLLQIEPAKTEFAQIRTRVRDEKSTVPRHGGMLVGPDQLRQVFNDTEAEVLWLIVIASEELEFLPGAKAKPDMSLIYPTDPTQLPEELAGVPWPPN